MNILLRHTLSSITRNPVQSVIVVVSTAMITACVLMCLCISSMFEQIATQWAGRSFAGADIYVHTDDNTRDTVLAFMDENADDVEHCFYASESDFVVTTDTQSIRGAGMGVYDLDEFDSVTSTDVIARTENTSSLPSAHVSTVFADAADIWLGDTFTLNNGREFFVEAITAATGRYFDQLVACFAYEFAPDADPHIIFIYLKDPDGLRDDGVTTDGKFWADKLRTINGYGTTQVDIGYVDSLVEDSVGGSMQLMTVAAVIISAVMACLLFSSFSVIVRGRVNELIKFKAAGATPAQSAFILIVEAALYAVNISTPSLTSSSWARLSPLPLTNISPRLQWASSAA